jgi:hypothetical protein
MIAKKHICPPDNKVVDPIAMEVKTASLASIFDGVPRVSGYDSSDKHESNRPPDDLVREKKPELSASPAVPVDAHREHGCDSSPSTKFQAGLHEVPEG